MEYSYNTLSEALNDLAKRGYVHDFNVHCDAIECKELRLLLKPEEFEIVEFYRFEGISDPDYEETVYAIESKNGLKGVMVNAMGAYSDSVSDEILQKLRVSR